MAIRNGDGENVGAVVAGSGGVSPGAVGVDGDGAVGGIGSLGVGQRIAVDITALDLAGDGRVLGRGDGVVAGGGVEGRVGGIVELGRVVDRRHIERDRGHAGAAVAIVHRVVEVDGPIEVGIRREGQRAVRVHRQHAFRQADRMGRGYGLAVDLGDGQLVAVRIGVIEAGVKSDGCIFKGGLHLAVGHWRVVGAYHHVDVAGDGGGAVRHGVAEINRAAEVGRGHEGEGAVGVQADLADGVAHRVFQGHGRAHRDGLAADGGDGERFAIDIGVIGQHRDRHRGVEQRCVRIVHHHGRVVGASDGDGERGGGGLASRIGDGVGEDVGLALAIVQRLRGRVGRVGVRAVGLEGQRAPCGGHRLAHGAGGGAKAHGRHAQAVAIHIGVGAHAADHTGGGRDGQCGVFSGDVGVGGRHWRVVDAAHVQGDRRGAGGARRVGHGVGEGGGAVVTRH